MEFKFYHRQVYSNNLIGEDQLSNREFCGSDNPGTFKENLKTKPDNWIYRTKKIEYNWNSYGHRSKELTEVVSDDYILFVGCSVTVGVGIALEDSFAYKLAQHLKMPYYNLGVAATGYDVITHNLNTFLTLQIKKPKIIVIQEPFWNRFFWLSPRGVALFGAWVLDPVKCPSQEHRRIYQEIVSSDINMEETSRLKFQSNIALIKYLMPTTKFINMTNGPQPLVGFNKKEHHEICSNARDSLHAGIFGNQKMFEYALQQL